MCELVLLHFFLAVIVKDKALLWFDYCWAMRCDGQAKASSLTSHQLFIPAYKSLSFSARCGCRRRCEPHSSGNGITVPWSGPVELNDHFKTTNGKATENCQNYAWIVLFISSSMANWQYNLHSYIGIIIKTMPLINKHLILVERKPVAATVNRIKRLYFWIEIWNYLEFVFRSTIEVLMAALKPQFATDISRTTKSHTANLVNYKR